MTDDELAMPDPSILNARPGEEEARAMLKISRLLDDLDRDARERVVAWLAAKYGPKDDGK